MHDITHRIVLITLQPTQPAVSIVTLSPSADDGVDGIVVVVGVVVAADGGSQVLIYCKQFDIRVPGGNYYRVRVGVYLSVHLLYGLSE